jgi:pimeloyl-ACP methyl ester carboxylesterase
LESEYDTIMPDMRGHGLSDRVRPGEKPDMAADLAGLIRTLSLSRPIIVGHSMGAMVAYRVGTRFAGIARALVLEDPPWWLSRPGQAQPTGPADENPIVKWAKDLPNHTLEELLEGYRADHPEWPDDLIRPMCESKKQLDPAVADLMANEMRSSEADWQMTIGNIGFPVLLVTADSTLGAIVTPEVAARIRELNPDVEIVTIPDTGHLIRFERYDAFMDALRAFLKKV